MKLKFSMGKITDERAKNIFDMINNIRTIKFYGWETPYIEKIDKLRTDEIRIHYNKAAFDSIAQMLNVSGLGFSLLITFGADLALGQGLNTADALATTSLLMLSHYNMTKYFAFAFHYFSLTRASAHRTGLVL